MLFLCQPSDASDLIRTLPIIMIIIEIICCLEWDDPARSVVWRWTSVIVGDVCISFDLRTVAVTRATLGARRRRGWRRVLARHVWIGLGRRASTPHQTTPYRQLKNYRLFSKLPFLSRLLAAFLQQRVITACLNFAGKQPVGQWHVEEHADVPQRSYSLLSISNDWLERICYLHQDHFPPPNCGAPCGSVSTVYFSWPCDSLLHLFQCTVCRNTATELNDLL